MVQKDYKKYEPLFGSWTINKELGEGSFGKVFEIVRHDYGAEYKSALKIITIPQNAGELESLAADGMDMRGISEYYESVVEDIVKEFVLMSKLKGNSNIVSYEDHQVIKHTNGIGWDILIRMELLTPLFRHIKEKPLTKKDIIKLGIDMCKALALCQKHNIIHRDIKPENIFFSDSGDYKLGDFGIARTIDKTTSELSKKGTYTYMAPEIYRGLAYGSNVDIYSLGIVMYRLLNENRAPFLPAHPAPITHNDREEALARRMKGEPLPKPKNADGRLAEIVLKACAFNPKDRYSAPLQMQAELEAILYSREEAPMIYPEGDTAPIKSVQYIATGEESTQPAITDKTALEFEQSIRAEEDERTESILGERLGEHATEEFETYDDKTESIFGEPKQIEIHAEMIKPQPQVKSHEKRKPQGKRVVAIGLLLLVIAGGAIWFAVSHAAKQRESFRQEAYALYTAGQYAQCVQLCESNEKMADDEQTNLILASAYFEQREYDKAAEIYYKIAAKNTEELSVDNLRDYAVCLGRIGRLDEAAAVFVMLTDKGASADVTDYVLGETYYAKADYDNAEQAFVSALEKAGTDELKQRIYLSLAETYREKGESKKSIALLKEAKAQPYMKNNTVLYEMLGAAYYAKAEKSKSKSDYLHAAEAFEKVITLGVQKDYLYVDVYAAYVGAGKYKKAKAILEDMETVYPTDYTPHALMACVLIMEENSKSALSRDYQAAYAEYQKAQELIRSEDDHTQMQQIEGLISRLKEGGWL